MLKESKPEVVIVDPDELEVGVPDLVPWLATSALYRPRILVLTKASREDDRIAAFLAGADDVVRKPYSARELALRLNALVRRSPQARPRAALVHGPISIDLDRRHAEVQGRALDLTRRELDLLHHLARHPGQVQTRERLIAELWGARIESPRVVDSTVKRLRRKLGTAGRLLVTVRGVGYRLDLP
jgi:two-component system phosphate regulon response regulator PhoB